MARPGRFELPTLCLEGRRSIRLSYGRVACYRNPITELAAFVFVVLLMPVLDCAQNCAHPAESSQQTRQILRGGLTEQICTLSFAQQCGPSCAGSVASMLHGAEGGGLRRPGKIQPGYGRRGGSRDTKKCSVGESELLMSRKKRDYVPIRKGRQRLFSMD